MSPTTVPIISRTLKQTISHKIPYREQFFVERERNTKFQWLCVAVTLAALFLHGVIFHWIPLLLRSRKHKNSTKTKRAYFILLKLLNTFNSSFRFTCFGKKYYIQPSLLLLFLAYLAITAIFSFVETIDLTYQPRKYIIAKRIGNLASGNLFAIYFLVTKNDFLSAVSGLKHDRLQRFHIWISRTVWVLATIHLTMCVRYWLDLGVPLMIYIPPQYFGMIAYGSCSILTWGSLKFFRKWSYEVFLLQHRFFSALMLLFVLFHNPRNRVIAILSIHFLVLDKVISRIVGWVHSIRSPSKRFAQFSLLNEETLLITIPMKVKKEYNTCWYNSFLPTINTWKAGQYVIISVPSIDKFGNHPFTISTLSESGTMKLIVKRKNGFTRRLFEKIKLMNENNEIFISSHSKLSLLTKYIEKRIIRIFDFLKEYINTRILKKPSNNALEENYFFEQKDEGVLMKLSINGPYGALYQDLTKFNIVSFLSNGVGASFTFPVCLDLLKTIERLDMEKDFFYRPENVAVHFSWNIAEITNVLWYRYILEQLIPFIDTKKLNLTIHITRVSQQSVEEEFFDCSKDGQTVSSDSVSIDDASEEKLFISSILNNDNIRKNYHRANLSENIQNIVKEVIDTDYNSKNKSVAFIGCGHKEFTKSIEYECQQNRWLTNCPDIYCYTETF